MLPLASRFKEAPYTPESVCGVCSANVRCHNHHVAKDLLGRRLRGHLLVSEGKLADGYLGDDQDVNGGDRVDIVEGEALRQNKGASGIRNKSQGSTCPICE